MKCFNHIINRMVSLISKYVARFILWQFLSVLEEVLDVNVSFFLKTVPDCFENHVCAKNRSDPSQINKRQYFLLG